MPERHLTPVNPWSTEDSGYSQDQFYMRSTDGHGQYRHMRVNVPPQVAGQINQLVQSDRYPYRTREDFIRDAVTHRLHYINEELQDPALSEAITAAVRKSRIEAINRAREELRGLVDACREAITAAALDQDWEALSDALEQAEAQGEEVREPYRTRIHEIVNAARKKHQGEL